MIRRIILVILILSLLTCPVAMAQSTQPADGAAVGKFPTPAELIEKMKQQRSVLASKTKVAYFDLSDPVSERPSSFSIFGGGESKTLHSILTRLQKAQNDDSVRAVLITAGADLEMNLAQAEELQKQLVQLRRAGKKTFIYADSYDTISYIIASGATNVCLAQGGEIMIPGVGMETMFYKGTFDKLGVSADYVQIGEFKGAEEPYTRSASSDELRGEMTKLTESLFNQIISTISLGRNLPSQKVREMVDDAMMTASVAKARGFVDHLLDVDGLRGLLKDELGNDVDLVRNYGEDERPEVDLSNPFLLLAALAKKPEPTTRPSVAVIYVDGAITDGEGGTSLLSGESGVGSDPMRRDLRAAARDENIKAIVLRIDSPGGSALASEMIWQAVRRVSQEAKKPVIVSVGSMAASGGYYIASASDYIFADSTAIVGSIGVVGGKFVTKDLFEKLGLKTETFTQGRNADLFSTNQSFNDRQRRMIKTWMQQTYDQFTQRILTTRKEKISDIDKVARGRIFLAPQAKELGLIDEIGGCDDAIAYAASKAGLSKGAYDIRTLPAPRSLAEYLGLGDAETASPLRPTITISADSVLTGLSPSARKLIGQQLQLMQLLEQRPVVLLSPFTVRVK